MTWTRRSVLAGMGAPALLPVVMSDRPHRIVSLNPCLDGLLLHLANRSQIASLSHYSSIRQQSANYALAQTFPKNHGTAEEIIALRPDLVLSSIFESRSTRHAIERLGVPVQRFGLPETLSENVQQIRDVADLVGHPARGESLISNIRRAIDIARPKSAARLRTLIYQPGGYAAGQGTLMHEMMGLAGLENVAGQYGVGKWGNVPLEEIIANPPQLLLFSGTRAASRTWSERMMTHPALARISGQIVRTSFDEKLLYCGGPVLIQTAAALAHARDYALEQLA